MTTPPTPAQLFRLKQAEQLLRESGFVRDEDGNWHPAE